MRFMLLRFTVAGRFFIDEPRNDPRTAELCADSLV
jgi:hypothetical protein